MKHPVDRDALLELAVEPSRARGLKHWMWKNCCAWRTSSPHGLAG